MESKYIPVQNGGLYYIFDSLNSWLYPCSKAIYDIFVCNSLQKIIQMNNLDDAQSELAVFMNLLLSGSNQGRYTLLSYPTFSRKDIELSLANTPNIVLELTRKCNLSCVYCCYGKLYKQAKHVRRGSNDYVVSFLQSLLSLRVTYHVMADFRISFYGGEPLLCMDVIKECVNLAQRMMPDVKISYGITTNGLLLNKYMEYLVENDFHILVSLDGNKENNQYRIYKNGKESFDDVVRNVQVLYLRYPLFFKNNVDFSTVLHGKSNYIDAIDFFAKWDKIPLFSQVTKENIKRKLGKKQEIFCMHDYSKEEIASFVRQYPKEYSILFPTAKGQCCLWQRNRQISVQALNEVIYDNYNIFPTGGCTLFVSKVFITEDGRIYLCEKSSRKFAFGKIHKGKLTVYLKRINTYYADMHRRFKTACLGCYKSARCENCFFAECENISSRKCFFSKEQAIAELQEMMTE